MGYEKMSQDDFDIILCNLINEHYSKSPSSLLQIPGIYEILSEHFNNEVLDEWKSKQPEPEEEPEE